MAGGLELEADGLRARIAHHAAGVNQVSQQGHLKVHHQPIQIRLSAINRDYISQVLRHAQIETGGLAFRVVYIEAELVLLSLLETF